MAPVAGNVCSPCVNFGDSLDIYLFELQGYWHPDVKKRQELLRYKREAYKEQVLHWIVDKQDFTEEELKLLKQVWCLIFLNHSYFNVNLILDSS